MFFSQPYRDGGKIHLISWLCDAQRIRPTRIITPLESGREEEETWGQNSAEINEMLSSAVTQGPMAIQGLPISIKPSPSSLPFRNL